MSTLTTIQSTDLITNSRANINDNFAALNADKLETSVLDSDTTLAADSDAKVPTQKAVKAYVDAGGNVNASTSAKGIVEEADATETLAGTAVGATGARLFVNPSNLSSIRTQYREYAVAGSPHTWTKASGLKAILVRMWGGGGSGACANVTFNGSEAYGGGGGGAYKEKWFTPSELGATETITVGAGGAAVSRSTVGYTAGNNGEQSSFGSLLIALGGELGTNRLGGNGGAVSYDVGTGGDTTETASANAIWGGAGGGRASSAGAYTEGGSSIYGGGGGGAATDTTVITISKGTSVYGGNGGNGVSNSSGAVTGGSGVTPAGGGGSAVATTGQVATSGAGGDGKVIVVEFY